MKGSGIPVSDQKKTAPDHLDEKVKASWQEVQDSLETLAINPVLGMHKAPRKTLDTIYRLNYPIIWPFLIMACAGISHALNQFVLKSDLTINSLFSSIATGAIAGPLVGLFVSFCVLHTGKLFGGTGSYRRILIAWGWSSAPSLFILIIWGLRFAIVGPDFFSSQTITDTASGIGSSSMVHLTMASAMLMIWQMILTVTAISEAHQFSWFRALGSLMVMFAVILVIFAFL